MFLVRHIYIYIFPVYCMLRRAVMASGSEQVPQAKMIGRAFTNTVIHTRSVIMCYPFVQSFEFDEIHVPSFHDVLSMFTCRFLPGWISKCFPDGTPSQKFHRICWVLGAHSFQVCGGKVAAKHCVQKETCLNLYKFCCFWTQNYFGFSSSIRKPRGIILRVLLLEFDLSSWHFWRSGEFLPDILTIIFAESLDPVAHNVPR